MQLRFGTLSAMPVPGRESTLCASRLATGDDRMPVPMRAICSCMAFVSRRHGQSRLQNAPADRSRPQVDGSRVDVLLCMLAGNKSVPGPGFVTYW